MIRLFQTHTIREQTELEGMWDFQPLTQKLLPETYQYSLPVPGCWEQHPDFLSYRGLGAYRRKIFLNRATNLRIEFKGVSHTADVYLDGQLVAHHYNAYTSFAAVVKKVAAGMHEIQVLVDNSFSEQSALHVPNDYFTYGGIIRPVALEKIGDVFIERVEFTPVYQDGEWRGTIKAMMTSIADSNKVLRVQSTLDGNGLDLGRVEITPGQTVTVAKTFEFAQIEPWCSENPTLYLLKTVIFTDDGLQPVDDLVERVGFRDVKVQGRTLCVNGKPVILKGFCRHEDFGLVGCAIPLQLMVKDLDLMQQMGANSVRTTHYPNDERFLDFCDERGIFVWEESHARGLSIEQMQNPNFKTQSEDCIREMVQNHFNHPAIIIWALLNECASDLPEGREIYQALIQQIKTLDGSRPVSFATCRFMNDICLDLADIVSYNLYYGWYNNNEISEAYLQQLAYIEKNGGAGKPVIISEFGAAAVYGMRDPARPRWSEEYQCDVLDECLSYYMNREEIVGTYIWQYSDCRITDEGEFYQSRPGTRNNKGIVDLYRRPKLAFDIVKKHYKLR